MPFDGTGLNETAAHLLRAKQYILDNGWCSRGASEAPSKVCMAVAINSTWDKVNYAAGCRALYFLGRAIDVNVIIGFGGVAIGRWNDFPGRTLKQVLTAFDRAIELAMADAT